MTEPSNQTPSKSAILRMDALIEAQGQWEKSTATRRAFALHLDEVDRGLRAHFADRIGDVAKDHLGRFVLPDPPDPDEELAREVAKKETGMSPFDPRWSDAYCAALATIKRLREQGRLTDAK